MPPDCISFKVWTSRLYARACSWSRTALCRKAWQLSRVQRSAGHPLAPPHRLCCLRSPPAGAPRRAPIAAGGCGCGTDFDQATPWSGRRPPRARATGLPHWPAGARRSSWRWPREPPAGPDPALYVRIPALNQIADEVDFLEDILDVTFSSRYATATERHNAMERLIDRLAGRVNPRYASKVRKISEENLRSIVDRTDSNAPGAPP
jgi:hypothetical protein